MPINEITFFFVARVENKILSVPLGIDITSSVPLKSYSILQTTFWMKKRSSLKYNEDRNSPLD
jgi:hypothetical protein